MSLNQNRRERWGKAEGLEGLVVLVTPRFTQQQYPRKVPIARKREKNANIRFVGSDSFCDSLRLCGNWHAHACTYRIKSTMYFNAGKGEVRL